MKFQVLVPLLACVLAVAYGGASRGKRGESTEIQTEKRIVVTAALAAGGAIVGKAALGAAASYATKKVLSWFGKRDAVDKRVVVVGTVAAIAGAKIIASSALGTVAAAATNKVLGWFGKRDAEEDDEEVLATEVETVVENVDPSERQSLKEQVFARFDKGIEKLAAAAENSDFAAALRNGKNKFHGLLERVCGFGRQQKRIAPIVVAGGIAAGKAIAGGAAGAIASHAWGKVKGWFGKRDVEKRIVVTAALAAGAAIAGKAALGAAASYATTKVLGWFGKRQDDSDDDDDEEFETVGEEIRAIVEDAEDREDMKELILEYLDNDIAKLEEVAPTLKGNLDVANGRLRSFIAQL